MTSNLLHLQIGLSARCKVWRLMMFRAPAVINTLMRASFLRCILTMWSRILLEKLTVPQLVKKFSSAFHGTWRFITVFTAARHLSPSGVKLNQSTPSRVLFKSHFSVTLPSTPSLPSDLFLSGFPTKKKNLHASLFSVIRATCPAHLVLLDLTTWIISVNGYKSWSS